MRNKTFWAVLGFIMLGVVSVALAAAITGYDYTNRTYRAVSVDAQARIITAGGGVSTVPVDDDSITACAAITNASVRYTLPTAGDPYTVCANGNSAYLLCGASGVPVATTAVNGHFVQIASGVCLSMTLTGPDCAVIGPSTAGQICFVHHVP